MSLRNTVLRGGIYLMVRQLVGMAIALVGMLILTRAIGPGAYGVYVAATLTYAYLYLICQWGIGIHLIRKEGEVDDREFHQAFTLLMVLSVLGLGATALVIPAIGHWLRFDGFGEVAWAVFAVLPLHMATLVPTARLERALDYRKVAGLELAGQFGFYAAALPFAVRGHGEWAPVAGWWVQQLIGGVAPFVLARYRPRLVWDRGLVRAMLGYGLSYQASVVVWQGRQLVNPLIVGRFAGAEAVGIIALAIRMVDNLSFAKNVTWRLSVAALTKLEGDKARLTRAVTEGNRLQVMALAPSLIAFSLAGPWLVPLLFGPQWLPMLTVFPFIALGNLVNGAFNLHYSALYALRHNWEVAVFRSVHVAMFAGSALVLVPWLGSVGYGWAELVAVGSYAVAHWYAVRLVGPVTMLLVLAWTAAAGVALFWPWFGPWAALGPMVVLVWPETWKVLGGYWGSLRTLKQA